MCFMLSAYHICIKLYMIPSLLATHYCKNPQKNFVELLSNLNSERQQLQFGDMATSSEQQCY